MIKWVCSGGLLLLVALAAAIPAARSQVVTSGGVTVPTLQQQLETGLLARTPSEREFVKKVVTLVDDGTLPLSLVNSTFGYARFKRPYPMPYFERALKIRAKRAGISI